MVANKYFIDDRLTIAVLEPLPLAPSKRRVNSGGQRHGR